MKNIINSVLMLLLFVGCKGQKEGVRVKKMFSNLPLKIEFVGKKDSTLVKLYIPQEFSLKSTYNKQITIGDFQYRNRDIMESSPNVVKGVNEDKNILISPPYKIKLNRNEEQKFILYIGYYLYLSDEELKILNYEKYEGKKINDIGNINDYSKTLNKLIPKAGYIYVTIYNKETLLIPDIEIPIEFKW